MPDYAMLLHTELQTRGWLQFFRWDDYETGHGTWTSTAYVMGHAYGTAVATTRQAARHEAAHQALLNLSRPLRPTFSPSVA
ncbi:hypothetical protein EXIGLDRAFT_716440 [Exidia glandulosa HHB12029]|uniref:DRBM domain-containing protein n=1 Tax=Exidia glandulosa HHB12029 TaxID=1314781 RepID=A0A165P8C3_EXIGL|nr:hypothetical protein EXIGLDRAFT_716440 [Exidia glandulosa HHB12029]